VADRVLDGVAVLQVRLSVFKWEFGALSKHATDARPCNCFTLRRMSCITARASRSASAASNFAS